MNNWKRIIAAAGTAALLISNLGSISQLAFATEPAAESAVNADEPELGSGKDTGDDQGTILEGEETESKDIGDGTGSLGDGSDQKGSGDDASDNDENDSEDADEADEETSEDEESEDESDPSDEEQGTDGEEPPVTDPAADIPATEPEEGTPAEEQPAVYSLDDSLEVSLETRESSKRDVKRNDDGDYLYNIGETASTTIRISNPENYALDENDNAVVRLYMQFTDTASTDEHANGAQGKTKSPGTYMLPADDDTEYRYTVYEIKDGLYGYEFERPIKGDSYEVELTSIYKDDTEGGTNRIWTAILAEDEAEELDRDVAEESPEQSDNADANHDDSSNDVENYASDDAGAEEPSEENTDDDHVIGIADLPEDEDDIITLRWADPETAYPAFEDEQTMADGTVITIDAPEGAFPEGTRLALEVKDAEDYLDAIRAYKGDETLTADGWLAYDFDFYTDDDHHNIEPLSRIKVTFSNLTRLTELAEQAAEAGSEETASDDAGSDGIMLTDLAEDAEETDTVGTTGGSDTTESGESTGANVAVYHIADSTEDGDDENVAGTVTETTVTDVDAEAGVIEIESDQFSVQLLDLNDGIMLAAYNTYNVNHIDIDMRLSPEVTVDGKKYTTSISINAEDYTKGRVTITGTYNGNVVYGPRSDFKTSDLDSSTDDAGNAQVRVNDTFYIGSGASDAVYYTFQLIEDCTFTASDGSTFVAPVTFSTRFQYFQSENVCPGVQKRNGIPNTPRSGMEGMDFEITNYSFGLMKEIRDADSKELIQPDGDYTASFTVTDSSGSDNLNIAVGKVGFGYGIIAKTGSTTVTESTPPQTVDSGGTTYKYTSTTVNNGSSTSTGLSATGTASANWVVTNYYTGKPLVVKKEWFEKDGTTPIEDTSRLPSSITGTLKQRKYKAATEGKEADKSVTLTIQASYRNSYGTYTTATIATYDDVAVGGSFTGDVYGYAQYYTTIYERNINDASRSSGSATVSRSGNTITVSNITTNTTVLVTYQNNWNNYLSTAPEIQNASYNKADTTGIDPTPEVDEVKDIPFELTADGGWRKEFKSAELDQESGYTYTYWVEEDTVAGYRTTVDYDSQENPLDPTTSEDKKITISNIKEPAKVRLKKVDPDQNVLNDATFTLADSSGQYYDSTTGTFIAVSGETLPSFNMGTLELELEDGTYMLTETKAPDGYNRSDAKSIVITNSVVTVDGKALVKGEDGYYEIPVINTPGYVLPDTGGSGTWPMQVGGSAAILASMFAGCSMWRRRRSERRCN